MDTVVYEFNGSSKLTDRSRINTFDASHLLNHVVWLHQISFKHNVICLNKNNK